MSHNAIESLFPHKAWSGYNNAGIAAVAIGCVLNHSESQTLAKLLLILPIVMHSETVKFLASEKTRSREIASLVAMRPDFVINFSRRYHASLAHSINAIQLLYKLEHVDMGTLLTRSGRNDTCLTLRKNFVITSKFGNRASVINKASFEIAKLLQSTTEVLYSNLRIEL